MFKKTGAFAAVLFFSFLISCSGNSRGRLLPEADSAGYKETQHYLSEILDSKDLPERIRYSVINRIAGNMLSVNDFPGLIIFLTQWVEQNRDDPYNAYWLLMTAYVYLENDANPLAEYYFERIINDYDDLTVQG